MSFRFMRVMVLFDLPTTTSADLRAYRKFRKNLLNSGFYMIQESVYAKLVLNPSVADSVMSEVKRKKPPSGFVLMMVLTENQFSKMQIVVGEMQNSTLDSTNRVVIV